MFCLTLTGGEPGQSVTRVCDWNGAFILIFIRTFIRSTYTGDWTDTFVYYRNVRGERDCGEPGVPARQGRCAEGYEVPGGEAVTGAPQLVHRRSGGGVRVINY